jgi:hypothetical protein
MIRARANPLDDQTPNPIRDIERKSSAAVAPPAMPKRNASNLLSSPLGTGSMNIYHAIKQHARLRRKANKRRSDDDDDSASPSWTVQIPKRMLLTTLGIFLVLPLLLFFWKETHPEPITTGNEQRMDRKYANHRDSKMKDVTWMEGAGNLTEDIFNETEDSAELVTQEINSTIAERPSASDMTALTPSSNKDEEAVGLVRKKSEDPRPQYVPARPKGVIQTTKSNTERMKMGMMMMNKQKKKQQVGAQMDATAQGDTDSVTQVLDRVGSIAAAALESSTTVLDNIEEDNDDVNDDEHNDGTVAHEDDELGSLVDTEREAQRQRTLRLIA